MENDRVAPYEGAKVDTSSGLKLPLRVVLIGANREGRGGELADAIKQLPDLVNLVGVCDCNPDVLKTWTNLPAFSNVEDLLASVKADAAVIALPHSAYRLVRPVCLRYGLGLLHEKPLACSLSELLELQEQLTNMPVPLVVGVQRRSHPTYRFLYDCLQRDRPHTVVIEIALGRHIDDVVDPPESQNKHDTKSWRNNPAMAGGGALIDIGYHGIDLAHYLLDAPFQTLTCTQWRGDRPVYENELESSATLVGRCGDVWVKIRVNRAGQKGESVIAIGNSRWFADRKVVFCDNENKFECSESWDLATRARIVELVETFQSPKRSINLWDHLAELKVIEQARTLARMQGNGVLLTNDGLPINSSSLHKTNE